MKLVIDISYDDYRKVQDGRASVSMMQRAIRNGTPLPRCKDCKYFEYDSVEKINGMQLIVAHEICSKWADGCKTREDGYCFLFEPQERGVSDADSN